MNIKNKDVWTPPMKETMKEILEYYILEGVRREAAVVTLGLCCEWVECEEDSGGVARLSEGDAKKSLRVYVAKSWKRFNSEGDLTWAEKAFLWLVLKIVMPWVLKRFLKNLNKQ
jgi:hypothetical protein